MRTGLRDRSVFIPSIMTTLTLLGAVIFLMAPALDAEG